jgi:hypothetical protein
MHPFFPNFVIARAKPLAIHWSSVNEETNPPASYRDTMDCRVGHLRSLLAMTMSVYGCRFAHCLFTPPCHREPLAGVAIHWFSVTEPQFLYAFIACSGLPRRSLACPPRNDNECVWLSIRTLPLHPTLSSRAPCGRGDPLVLSNRTAVSVRVHCMQWIAASSILSSSQ